MTRTEFRNTRAARLRKKRQRRMKRLRALLILTLAVFAAAGGVNLARMARGGGIDLENGVPLLLQTDERWKDAPYGSSTVEISGCGPTCLSMVIMALTQNQSMTPDAVAQFSEQNGYYVDGVGTSWSLMTSGAKELGLRVREVSLSEDVIADKLNDGYPIICSVTQGDFTNEGHFIVLTSYENGIIRVNDPNSEENSKKSWSYDRLKGQISAMWMYRK